MMPMFDPQAVADLDLLTPDGGSLPAGRLWRDQTVVLALVRHFG